MTLEKRTIPLMLLQLYRVRLRTLGTLAVRNLPGIPLEGAFTAGLRAISCGCRSAEAETRCPLGRRCALHLLARPLGEHFEDLPKRFHPPPAPVVLRPRFSEGIHPPGALLDVEVVLIGEARLEWVLAGLAAAGRQGIGPTRHQRNGGRFEVAEVEMMGPAGKSPVWEGTRSAPSAQAAWRFPRDFLDPPEGTWEASGEVHFRTPTALLLHQGKPSLRFADLVRTASQHVSLLEISYTDEHHFDLETHTRLLTAAEEVRLVASECEWTGTRRRSSRQGRSFPIRGWVGRARYAGDLRPFLPLLRLVSLVHVTGHAIRGCGEIALTP
jgi:hypothetical protein